MPQIGGAMKLSPRTFGEFWVMDAAVAAGCQSASKFRGPEAGDPEQPGWIHN
jgi:hypothetical protein